MAKSATKPNLKDNDMAKQATKEDEAKAGTAMAKIGGRELAVPDFMKDDMGKGLGTENIGVDDIEVPRLKLMQALSPELEEYEFLRKGTFFHTLSEEDMGQEVEITPLYVEQRYLLWNPKESGGGILARADDGIHWQPANASFDVKLPPKMGGVTVKWVTKPTVAQSGLSKWGTSNPADINSPPAATRMYNIVAAFPGFPDLPPAVITLQRSSIKVARKLQGRFKVSRYPLYALKFLVSSTQEQGPSGPYHNFRFVSNGIIEDGGMYASFKSQHEFFKSRGLNIKDEQSLQDEAGGEHGDDREGGDTDDGKHPKF